MVGTIYYNDQTVLKREIIAGRKQIPVANSIDTGSARGYFVENWTVDANFKHKFEQASNEIEFNDALRDAHVTRVEAELDRLKEAVL